MERFSSGSNDRRLVWNGTQVKPLKLGPFDRRCNLGSVLCISQSVRCHSINIVRKYCS